MYNPIFRNFGCLNYQSDIITFFFLVSVDFATSSIGLEDLRVAKKRRIDDVPSCLARSDINPLEDDAMSAVNQDYEQDDHDKDGIISTTAQFWDTTKFWDIPAVELRLGTPLVGFGEYVQCRALEVLADEVRFSNSNTESTSTTTNTANTATPLDFELLYPQQSIPDRSQFLQYGGLTNSLQARRRLAKRSVELNSLSDLVHDYLDYTGWPTVPGLQEPVSLEVPSCDVDGDSMESSNDECTIW